MEVIEKINSREDFIDDWCARKLKQAGVLPCVVGYQYLKESIKFVVDIPDGIFNITKDLYPEVAQRYNTAANRVERGIRHAIQYALIRNDVQGINEVLGSSVLKKGESVSNKAFICLMAETLNSKLKYYTFADTKASTNATSEDEAE